MNWTRINIACKFAFDTANDNSHGYTQGSGRVGPTDYDCSGLVCEALIRAGYPLGGHWDTASIGYYLEKVGFRRRNYQRGTLKRGSIELKPKTSTKSGHVAICIDSDKQIISEAYSNEFGGALGGRPGDQTGNEIRNHDDYGFGIYIYDPPEYFEPDKPKPKPEPVKPPRKPGEDIMSKPLYGNDFVRLYNPSGRMHHYTADPNEVASLVKNGWQKESVLGRIPSEGRILYRLCNPTTGEHFYTISYDEATNLVSAGWTSEGEPGVAHEANSGTNKVHSLYNSKNSSDTHLLTIDRNEINSLVSNGWKDEDVKFSLD